MPKNGGKVLGFSRMSQKPTSSRGLHIRNAQASAFILVDVGRKNIPTMRLRLALTALTTALSAGGSSAFAPLVAAAAGRRLAAGVCMPMPAAVAASTPPAAARRSYAATATSLQMANVLRLSNPMEEMLNDVDVFIFDCDGVIWRVSRVEAVAIELRVLRTFICRNEQLIVTRFLQRIYFNADGNRLASALYAFISLPARSSHSLHSSTYLSSFRSARSTSI